MSAASQSPAAVVTRTPSSVSSAVAPPAAAPIAPVAPVAPDAPVAAATPAAMDSAVNSRREIVFGSSDIRESPLTAAPIIGLPHDQGIHGDQLISAANDGVDIRLHNVVPLIRRELRQANENV